MDVTATISASNRWTISRVGNSMRLEERLGGCPGIQSQVRVHDLTTMTALDLFNAIAGDTPYDASVLGGDGSTPAVDLVWVDRVCPDALQTGETATILGPP